MILKAVTLFLIAMLVLGMFGKFRRLGTGKRREGNAVEPARKCRVCGTYLIGSSQDPCARPDCPGR
jgi:hypothetical protein